VIGNQHGLGLLGASIYDAIVGFKKKPVPKVHFSSPIQQGIQQRARRGLSAMAPPTSIALSRNDRFSVIAQR
jgi:hypothetical protein